VGRPDAFFLLPEKFTEPFVLTGGEAAHCSRVLRKRPGEIIRVFNGQGEEGLFTITDIGKDRVELTPVSLGRASLPESRLHVAAGFSRSARRDFFLEKAVELGAAGIIFWQAVRTQGHMPDAPKEAWFTTLVSAAKQCGAAHLPPLTVEPGGAAAVIEHHGSRFKRRFLLWEDPGVSRRLHGEDVTAPGEALFVIGPEGGLADNEAQLYIDAGFIPVSLGSRVLRWETAALAVLALGLA